MNNNEKDQAFKDEAVENSENLVQDTPESAEEASNTASETPKKHHEPLFHVVKRDSMPPVKSVGVRAAAIAIALVVCALVSVFMTGTNPMDVLKSLFYGTFGNERNVWNLFRDTAVLLCIALAVTPAFKMKFWNTGAEGQVLMGALASAACMICLGNSMPAPLLLILMIVLSILAGAVWGLIPAIFKANWGTNETLFTLMMNYVAIQLIKYCITIWAPNGSGVVGYISDGHLPTIFGKPQLLLILIVAVIVAVMYIYLKYSKQGYEISVVGESENTARYIGINVKKVIIRTMIISGALCGLAGFLIVSGVKYNISPDTAGGQGFTAIMVSWLAKFNPIYMVLTSFLLIFLQRGGSEIADIGKLSPAFPEILTGIILFFIIGCEFFINYQIKFRHKAKEEI